MNRTDNQLDKLREIKLADLPTPIEPLKRIGKNIRLDNLYIKRDDQTGLALGGNKARKLEFLVSDAIHKKSDLLFTLGGIQSNHVRMTAAAAAKYGLECHIWLLGNKPKSETGNILLDKILGAKIEYHPPMADAELNDKIHRYITFLHAEGRNPYYIPIGGSTGLGCLGYVQMIRELAEQIKINNLKIDTILTASGSGGTQAGLLLGASIYLPQTRIIGISVSRKNNSLINIILDIIQNAESILGVQSNLSKDNIILFDDYIGEKYGIPTDIGNKAIISLARMEGILLDPVYTGKAFSGLIDLRNRGYLKSDEYVLFIHTGGVPSLFAYPEIV